MQLCGLKAPRTHILSPQTILCRVVGSFLGLRVGFGLNHCSQDGGSL